MITTTETNVKRDIDFYFLVLFIILSVLYTGLLISSELMYLESMARHGHTFEQVLKEEAIELQVLMSEDGKTHVLLHDAMSVEEIVKIKDTAFITMETFQGHKYVDKSDLVVQKGFSLITHNKSLYVYLDDNLSINSNIIWIDKLSREKEHFVSAFDFIYLAVSVIFIARIIKVTKLD